jgi:hypothetical protein
MADFVSGISFRSLFALKVPKFRHSPSSAEAAAAADGVSLVNSVVTVLFTLKCFSSVA